MCTASAQQRGAVLAAWGLGDHAKVGTALLCRRQPCRMLCGTACCPGPSRPGCFPAGSCIIWAFSSSTCPTEQQSGWAVGPRDHARGEGAGSFPAGEQGAAVQVSIPSSPEGGGVVLALREPGAPHVPDLLTLLSPGQLVGFFGPVVRPVAELCVCRQRALSHGPLGCSRSAGG